MAKTCRRCQFSSFENERNVSCWWSIPLVSRGFPVRIVFFVPSGEPIRHSMLHCPIKQASSSAERTSKALSATSLSLCITMIDVPILSNFDISDSTSLALIFHIFFCPSRLDEYSNNFIIFCHTVFDKTGNHLWFKCYTNYPPKYYNIDNTSSIALLNQRVTILNFIKILC